MEHKEGLNKWIDLTKRLYIQRDKINERIVKQKELYEFMKDTYTDLYKSSLDAHREAYIQLQIQGASDETLQEYRRRINGSRTVLGKIRRIDNTGQRTEGRRA